MPDIHAACLDSIYQLEMKLRHEKGRTRQAQQERDDSNAATERLDVIFQSLPTIQQTMLEEYPKVVSELKTATEQLTALRNALEQAHIAGKYRITTVLQRILEGIAGTAPVYNESTMRWESPL